MSRSILTLCFLMLLVGGNYLAAQSPARPSNVGTEFFLSFPSNWDEIAGNPPNPQKYIRVYITSTVSTEVRVSCGPIVIETKTTLPNDIVTIDLPIALAQVIVRNATTPIPDDQVYADRAIRIKADDPITVYAINRITYTTDGILALPTTSLGREYIVASAADVATEADDGKRLPSQYVITAPYDNTVVTIINSWNTYGNLAGSVVTVAMMKGDVYSAMSYNTGGDLTGTTISSSKPVAVLAGSFCAQLPIREVGFCDHLVEMMLPVHAWGQIYHLVPFATRANGDYIRVLSGADNTTVSINGEKHRTLPTRGGGEGSGWFTLLELDRRLLEFTADKPICVAQYNNGQTYDGAVGDPFMLVLTPLEQYQTSFTFSTPGDDFPTNFINLVIDSSDWTNIEIAPGGTEEWRRLNAVTNAIPENFPTLINGIRYAGVTFEIAPGVYRLRGTKPSAGYIYGWSHYDSYGYPLSVTVADLASEPQTTSAPRTMDMPGLTIGPVAPTPSNGQTTLSYRIPSASSVEITLIDISGRTVATLLEKSTIAAGSHTLRFDVSALPAGSYFCRMSVGDHLLVQPLVVR